MEKKTITVNTTEVEQRLDKFLVKQFPNLSRSFIQKLIKEGKVTLNKKAAIPHVRLKVNDLIQIELISPLKVSFEPEPEIKLNIIFENQDFLILNKPAGIAIHPSQSTPYHTLVNGILAYYPEIKNVGEDRSRPGIVHRLDKDVSGVLVAAKNQKSFEHLKKQFQKRLIKKKYLALVYGKISPPQGEINFAISRSKSKPFRMAIKRKEEGKAALTYYRTIQSFNHHSLLELETKTGRTHQIRVHLFALGHPIVGDKIYHRKKIKTKENLKRIFLHANFLQFTNLQGEKLTFRVDLSNEIKQFLSKLN